jgi:hypothetical protein
VEENRLTEGGWDGEVSEKSLAMSPCGLFSTGRRQIWPLPGPSESLGMEKIQEAGHKRRRWVYNHSVRKAKMEIPV